MHYELNLVSVDRMNGNAISRWVRAVGYQCLAPARQPECLSVRWRFTARQMRPELPLIAAVADLLGAELRVVLLQAPQRRPSHGVTERSESPPSRRSCPLWSAHAPHANAAQCGESGHLDQVPWAILY
jgi:hypothetical protein